MDPGLITYHWEFTNADIASYDGPNPPLITPQSDAVDLSIELTVSNGCGPSVVVNELYPVDPATVVLDVPDPAAVCLGDNVVLSITGGNPGTLYTWYEPDGDVSPLGTGPTITITGATADDAGPWNVNAGTSACGEIGSATVIVNQPPVLQVIDPAPICPGFTVDITADASGVAGNYQWTGGPTTADLATFGTTCNNQL